ncbi:hypothetical protein HMPREF9306_00408 [Propionimicrobium lymphophilum ACS-093-V-SCH5]|uniref:Uncharacterized protein n=1 Tax=Propionimicrobium lymphophilum ACS-093-V-SCH5 TaxID=883161 RepID=S2W1K3_9ACTN|nr:hypothetical protein HMPREF9306_00408 [Propionimicrobium lymphophilum ACS-093-V-SCH5]
MAADCGQTINPYSVSFKYVSTADEFSTSRFRVELRRGSYNGGVWVWLRVTTRYASNLMMGTTEFLSTPCGKVTGLPYGWGNNRTPNSSRCSKAICLGQPASVTTVTYGGGGEERSKSKKVRV